jgi:hypothetical protein
MVLGRSNLNATGLMVWLIVNGPAHLGSNLLQPGCTIRMFFVDSNTLSPTLNGIIGFLFGSVMAIILDLADCNIICVCVTACFIASVNWNAAGISDLMSRKQCCIADSALILVAVASTPQTPGLAGMRPHGFDPWRLSPTWSLRESLSRKLAS